MYKDIQKMEFLKMIIILAKAANVPEEYLH